MEPGALLNVIKETTRNQSFPERADVLYSLATEDRVRLLEELEFSKRELSAPLDEDLRLTLAQALVVLLPDSLSLLREFLSRRNERHEQELHFSIFLALTDYRLEESTVALALLNEVERYINGTRVDPAHSAWMAADLLGDYWPPALVAPVLDRCVRTARYVRGRLTALHGLRQAVRSLDDNLRAFAIEKLRYVATHDRSQNVRHIANCYLEDVGQS